VLPKRCCGVCFVWMNDPNKGTLLATAGDKLINSIQLFKTRASSRLLISPDSFKLARLARK
jgi:hypothetical protein